MTAKQCFVGLLVALAMLAPYRFGAAQEELSGESAVNQALRQNLERLANAPPPATADSHELAIYLHKRGNANLQLGRYGQAVADLREALRLHQPSRLTPNEWGDRWRLDGDLGVALEGQGDLLAALEHQKSRPYEWRTTLRALHPAKLQLSLGMFADADKSYAAARQELATYSASRGASPLLMAGWRGSVESLGAQLQEVRGNRVEGERLRRLALRYAEAANDIASRLRPGDAWRERVGPGNLRDAKRALASNLSSQGKFGEAEFLARQYLAETMAYSTWNTVAAGVALGTLGVIRQEQGKLVDAERLFGASMEAISRAELLSHSTALASSRARLGTVNAMQGRWGVALRWFEERAKGLQTNPDQLKTISALHIDYAMSLHHTGRSTEALEQFGRMIAAQIRRPFVDPVALAHLRGFGAIALSGQGQMELAANDFEAALPVLLARADEDASNDAGGFVGAWRLRRVIEGYLELLAKCQAGTCKIAGLDPVAEAFRLADVARGSAVQRAVTSSVARASLPNPRLLELARTEQTTANRIQSLRKIVERLASSTGDQRLGKIIADMQRDIAQLESEQKSQRKQLASQFPEYANLVDPAQAQLPDVRKALHADEALVAIYVAEKASYVWTLTRDRQAFRVVAKGWAEVARAVGELRARLEFVGGAPSTFDDAMAHALYTDFMAPDAALWSGARVLNIIPHGPLGQLPFGVLLTEPPHSVAMSEKPWLIRKLSITQLPSANAFLALRRSTVAQAPPQSLVGFGDPLFASKSTRSTATRALAVRSLAITAQKDEMLDLFERGRKESKPMPDAVKVRNAKLKDAFALLPALPDTADELGEIARTLGADATKHVYLGARATEHNVKSHDLSRYRVVVFATHGLVPGDLPGLDQPALALSNPQLTQDTENDGFLTMEEVLALQLNADWVVLSACNTASPDGLAGEAVSGLGRAFFYAGARSLLVSNWPVETVSARLLTTGVFKGQAADARVGRAEALRQSMLNLMSNPAYAHPVFWAPFSLVGDGGR
jgi:CHAT domain-containing protein